MSRNKKAIRRSFSRAASTYDLGSEFQREVAVDLAGYIATLTGYETLEGRGSSAAGAAGHGRAQAVLHCGITGTALETGCGTGHFTSELKKVCPGVRVYASDISRSMLVRSRAKNGGRLLAVSDCESLAFKPSSFGLVASSLTYQWATDLEAAFTEAERVLKPGGLFVFSTLGPATLSELRTSYVEACGRHESTALMEFKGADEISKALGGAGLTVIRVEPLPVIKIYGDLFSLLRTLKAIGASPPAGRGSGLSTGELLKKAAGVYMKRFPAPGGGGITATYEVIFAAARKEP